eukprot:CAMPEP_0170555652 /NCGR_PEP_ID=MMETSP0211-20121228/13521_1 /TAXON_ID=311385 /ORGANISM="Pseudokeronopsis sp., Strain OXSARD2" /LENGTH=147 /DNA_ID=CAMNT_0010865605 /DNA_START=1203 /DNA_END=1642 /DNA_ORIENTATION=-
MFLDEVGLSRDEVLDRVVVILLASVVHSALDYRKDVLLLVVVVGEEEVVLGAPLHGVPLEGQGVVDAEAPLLNLLLQLVSISPDTSIAFEGQDSIFLGSIKLLDMFIVLFFSLELINRSSLALPLFHKLEFELAYLDLWQLNLVNRT